jgi:membrane protein YqaA with SNARE-associated domain
MLNLALIAQKRTFTRSLLIWLHHLGGPGLILLGLLDNSVVPVPGSMDALTIILAANQRTWWPYYAAMATIGAVIGGYVTYQLAQKEGNERLKKKVPQDKMRKVESIFARWGFSAIAIAAVLPPPAPMVPFLIAAGATHYSRKKFLAALAVGRGIRYTILAALAAFYGRRILRLISHHATPVAIVIIILILAVVATILFLRYGRRKPARQPQVNRSSSRA